MTISLHATTVLLRFVLAPALVASIFFLTRELTSNDQTAIFASLLTAISFPTLIGLYGGFYANWIAMIFGVLSLGYLIKSLKKPDRQNFVIFSILIILLLFSHVYTWTIFSLFIVIFLGIMYKLRRYERKVIGLLFLIVLVCVAIDISKSSFTEGKGGIEQDIAIATNRSGIENITLIDKNLTEAIFAFAGGQFSNFLILSLCVFWLLLSNFRDKENIFIAVFFSIGVLPILFGNDVIQFRILYLIPFQIPAAIGLTYLLNRKHGILMVFAIGVWILAMSVRAVANFL